MCTIIELKSKEDGVTMNLSFATQQDSELFSELFSECQGLNIEFRAFGISVETPKDWEIKSITNTYKNEKR